MADKQATMFWIKHLVVALVVLIAALLVLQYIPATGTGSIQSSGQPSESSGSIEENLTRFYEKFSLTSQDPIKEQYGDYVIPLAVADATQTEQLVAIIAVDKAPTENWEGEFKFRSFAKGTTIRTEAIKYAEQEGMQLLWDLNQDFIIRHRFLSENSLLGTLDDVANAIDANFLPEVNVYFCNKKRAIVLAEKAGTYVTSNCKKASVN